MGTYQQEALDAIIIAGDLPQSIGGNATRDELRLTLNNHPATLGLLKEYFLSGRNAHAAAAVHGNTPPPFLSINGPYLCQFLEGRGLRSEWIPILTRDRARFLELLARNPRAVVISTTFLPVASLIDDIAAYVKSLSPQTTVIAGGIKIWKSYKKLELLRQGRLPEDVIEDIATDNFFLDAGRNSPVDYLIISESGEESLASLLECLKNGQSPEHLPNLAYFQNSQWRINEIREESRLEVKVDWSRISPRVAGVYTPVQAGMGCRFRCAFCDFWGLRPLHIRPVDSIIEEIGSVPPQDGVRRINFTDDNLFSSRKHTREICQAILKSGMRLRWRSFMRVDVVDGEIAELMARAGCEECALGIESGDANMLKRMHKGTTPERILSGVYHLNRCGIGTESTFVVGFPGETEASIQNTINLLNAYETSGPGIHRFILFSFMPMPLSRAFAPGFRSEHKIRGYLNHWTHATMDSAEAKAQMVRIYDSVKLELNPVYIELNELPQLMRDERKRALYLRNWIKRCQRGLTPGADEPRLWDELETLILSATREHTHAPESARSEVFAA